MSTLTSYSVTGGGGRGYINIGGWNTTLTDRSTNPQEVCGMIRFEGANKYMYVCGGLSSSPKGNILSVKTAVADLGAGAVPPVCMTAMPITDNINLAAGMALQTMLTQLYCWVLREGIATAYAGTDSAFVVGTRYVFGAATAHVCGVATASGQAIALEAAATAVASAAGQGAMCYMRFGR